MRGPVIASLLVLLGACSGPVAAGAGEVARGSAVFEPSAPASDLAGVVAADTSFGFDLLRRAWSGDNLIISPFSIATALGMLEAGAKGDTRSEMTAVLHETLPEEALHAARGALLATLATEPAATEDTPPPFTLRAVNSLWAQSGYQILQDYLDVLSGSYDSGVSLLDFVSNPEAPGSPSTTPSPSRPNSASLT